MLDATVARRLTALADALVDQRAARVVVPPTEDASGFWFGGGNMVQAPDGTLYLIGRYRDAGDSRTGVGSGVRGRELAVFASHDGGATFDKVVALDKAALSAGGREVLSIEGAALALRGDGVEVFVSTEKTGVGYPAGYEDFLKPGTGVWSVDRLAAPDVPGLARASVTPLLASEDPRFVHVKDPVVHRTASGATVLVVCTHPFSWSSSNAAYCVRPAGEEAFGALCTGFFPRGETWDVAVSRITDVLTLPADLLDTQEGVQLVFYDGAECVRQHEQHGSGVARPRGYSCEEIAGLAAYEGDAIESIERVASVLPRFVSPWGSGSSRYIHALATDEGLTATWQQARTSGAQALVLHTLPWDEVRRIVRA